MDGEIWEQVWRGGFCRIVDYGGSRSGAGAGCEKLPPMTGYRKSVKMFRFSERMTAGNDGGLLVLLLLI